ncbi:MAG: hypothetical protein RLZZ301_1641 [Bacteroidota bacterium]|jgi:antitoxin MazE
MRIPIIQIGNSKGLRLPKVILEKYKIQEEMELQLQDQHIILKPIRKIREGWSEAFAQMHANGDDRLLIDDIFPDEIVEE